jgi:hypothetical protein
LFQPTSEFHFDWMVVKGLFDFFINVFSL